MKLNVGLIGLGRLGRVYAHDLAARVTGVNLAALADTNAKLAEEIARELNVPRWYSDPIAMLDDPGIDAAVIVSPTDTHTSLAVAALERKKAVRRAKRIGTAHIFEASISKGAAHGRLVDELFRAFGSSMQPLMAHLIDSGKLTLKDVKEAEEALRKLSTKKGKVDD